jgi:molybdopterin converting factor small subunit
VTDRENRVDLREGASLADLIAALDGRYDGLHQSLFDEAGDLRRYVNIRINGRNARLSGGDRNALFPPAGESGRKGGNPGAGTAVGTNRNR